MHDPIPVVTPADQKSRVRSFFDDSKPWQGDMYGDASDYTSRLIRRRKDYAIAMLSDAADLRPGKALDIGCGSGVYLEELLARGFDTTGLDLSAEMLDSCRKRFEGRAEYEDRLSLVRGDVETLPFQDGEFDLIVCMGVLGYLVTDERAVAEIRRVLRPGGYILLSVTNLYSLADADAELRRRMRSAVRPSRSGTAGPASPPYAQHSEWMVRHRGYYNKSYDLPKFEDFLAKNGLNRVDAMTYGFEFRLLRRTRLVPARWLDRLELSLERLGREGRLPLVPRAGWGYTGLFRKGGA